MAYAGFALLLWPCATRGVVSAFVDAGSSLFTLGFAVPAGTAPAVIVFLAAATRLVILTLQIAYLPTLYAAFNRRETQVALLSSGPGAVVGPGTAGANPLRARNGGVDLGYDAGPVRAVGKLGRRRGREPHHLPGAAQIPLAGTADVLGDRLAGGAGFCRAFPGPVPPGRAGGPGPAVPARRLQVLQPDRPGNGFDIPDEPGPDATTSVTYAEFLDAVGRMREVGFPIERDPAEAWLDFVGWRVNYEQAAYAVAAAVYAVPALWSGPRRHKISPIAPIRPGRGHPPK